MNILLLVAVHHSHMNALYRHTGKPNRKIFALPFGPTRGMNRHAPSRRGKRMITAHMTNAQAHSLASAAVLACQNCGTTGGYIEEIWTDDGGKPLLCEDCAGEVRRLEKLADELAAAPSCQQRQQILDTVETTTELVNRLRAHDMMQCVACASARTSAALDPHAN
jgi:putative hemolysin